MNDFKENDLVSFIDKNGDVQLCYVVLTDNEQQKSMVESKSDQYWIENSALTLESRMQ